MWFKRQKFCLFQIFRKISPSIVMISCQSLKPLPYMYVKILPGCLVMQKKVYKFQKLGFEILETQETLLKKHELKLKYANNIIQNQEDHITYLKSLA